MTHDEAVQVAHAVLNADGGCVHCVMDIAVVLMRRLPDVDWRQALADADHFDERDGWLRRDFGR